MCRCARPRQVIQNGLVEIKPTRAVYQQVTTKIRKLMVAMGHGHPFSLLYGLRLLHWLVLWDVFTVKGELESNSVVIVEKLNAWLLVLEKIYTKQHRVGILSG